MNLDKFQRENDQMKKISKDREDDYKRRIDRLDQRNKELETDLQRYQQ